MTNSRAQLFLVLKKEICVIVCNVPLWFFCRYTVISGTPEKILDHFLETMRLDIHHNEPGD